jgi:DNA mismatch repair protein MutL
MTFMSIHLLLPEVASQIAAGEVIERPASVVKELIENSLDAGAQFITVSVEGGGRILIEVSDDGAGIASDELPLAVARHATSKLTSADDLFHIATLGFRGEALASIGSVALLTITSRQANSEFGARLRVEAGQAGSIQTTGAPAGTLIRVENLFFNVPARLKFLKNDSTERSQIDALVTRYAMAYPKVRFHLKQEARLALQTSGNGDRREVLSALYGVDTARQMLEVLADYDDLRITGFISPISLTRSNRKEVTFFVNGRPVQDPMLTTALLQAYHNLLMVGRFPMAVLFLEMPPQLLDVNVHPTKAEVRFQDRDLVFSAVQRAVRRALLAYTQVPDLDASPSNFPAWKYPGDAPSRSINPAWGMSAELRGSAQDETQISHASTLLAPDQAHLPGKSAPLLRLVGQLASTYLVAEGPDGLYLIDQHAAHERVLFERFMSQRGSDIPSQTLLQPVAVDLPPASARLLSDQIPLLGKLGFHIEPFGPATFLVRGIPTLLAGSPVAEAVKVVVEDFEEDETPLQAEIEARLIARVCKRAAVKAGHILSAEEQQALLNDLEACQSPRTCPHGRPTMIHISVDLLDRQFGRKGAR